MQAKQIRSTQKHKQAMTVRCTRCLYSNGASQRGRGQLDGRQIPGTSPPNQP